MLNKLEKIKEIVEDMYDTVILKPLNELQCHRKSIKKLCLLLNYNDMAIKLLTGKISSCSCMTKTPDPQYHDKKCKYRIDMERIL